MGFFDCFGGEKCWIKKKEKRRAKKRLRREKTEAKELEKRIVKKDEKQTSGGVGFLLEIAPTKKRVLPGLLPVERRPQKALEDFQKKARAAEERRRERLTAISRQGAQSSLKHAMYKEKRDTVEEARRKAHEAHLKTKMTKYGDRKTEKERARKKRSEEERKHEFEVMVRKEECLMEEIIESETDPGPIDVCGGYF